MDPDIHDSAKVPSFGGTRRCTHSGTEIDTQTEARVGAFAQVRGYLGGLSKD